MTYKTDEIWEDKWVNTTCGVCYCGCACRVRVVNGVPVKVEGIGTMITKNRIDQLAGCREFSGFPNEHPVKEYPGRKKMFLFTCNGATPASDTPFYVDYHSPSRHNSSFINIKVIPY